MKDTLSISEHISTNWYSYAKYVITKRGIANFYDGLTNVQRVILDNAPTKYTKTVSVVGSVIKSGYHHGDASITGALNSITKDYGCSMPMLDGDGFFGTPISDEAAAPRYTSVKINNQIKEEVDKFKALNKYNDEGLPEKFHTDIPLGSVSGNTGIGIGFKSHILPRNLEELKKYLNGDDSADLRPHFTNFDGRVESYGDDPSKWVVVGKYKVKKSKSYHIIQITELPPIDKYDTFIGKINKFLDKKNISKVKITNNSQTKINLELKTKSDRDFAEIKKYINRTLRSVTTENVGFIRDGRLVEYNSYKDYLDDFKIWREEVYLKKMEYDLGVLKFDLTFNEAKYKFLKYMQGRKATRDEIKKFLEQFDNEKITNRLISFPLYKMSTEEIETTRQEIDLKKSDIKSLKVKIKEQGNTLAELQKGAKSKAINYEF